MDSDEEEEKEEEVEEMVVVVVVVVKEKRLIRFLGFWFNLFEVLEMAIEIEFDENPFGVGEYGGSE